MLRACDAPTVGDWVVFADENSGFAYFRIDALSKIASHQAVCKAVPWNRQPLILAVSVTGCARNRWWRRRELNLSRFAGVRARRRNPDPERSEWGGTSQLDSRGLVMVEAAGVELEPSLHEQAFFLNHAPGCDGSTQGANTNLRTSRGQRSRSRNQESQNSHLTLPNNPLPYGCGSIGYNIRGFV